MLGCDVLPPRVSGRPLALPQAAMWPTAQARPRHHRLAEPWQHLFHEQRAPVSVGYVAFDEVHPAGRLQGGLESVEPTRHRGKYGGRICLTAEGAMDGRQELYRTSGLEANGGQAKQPVSRICTTRQSGRCRQQQHWRVWGSRGYDGGGGARYVSVVS